MTWYLPLMLGWWLTYSEIVGSPDGVGDFGEGALHAVLGHLVVDIAAGGEDILGQHVFRLQAEGNFMRSR